MRTLPNRAESAQDGLRAARPPNQNRLLRSARDILEETIWSSRCAVCDAPGSVLCDSCKRNLAYIDRWQACPRCGAAFGRIICTECNTFTLQRRNVDTLPYGRCTSAVVHDGISRRIVTAYKDGGDRRLATEIARITASSLSPLLADKGTTLTFVPASARARRRRGFDHAQEVAELVSRMTGMPYTPLFDRPRGRDQRGLTREQRMANMRAQMHVQSDRIKRPPQSVLIFDDVYTTGATLLAASAAARDAGCSQIACVTFTRVC